MKKILGAILVAFLLGGSTVVLADTPDTSVFFARMTGASENPPIPGSASAIAKITVFVTRDGTGNLVSGTVDLDLVFSFPSPVTLTGLHIHNGPVGVNAGVVIGLGPFGGTLTEGRLTRRTEVTAGTALAALNGLLKSPHLYYINLHTPVSPGGAIRGQLLPSEFTFHTRMTTAEETPPVTGLAASGVATITVRAERDNAGNIIGGNVDFDVKYNFPGAINITGLHIHDGAAGVLGPVRISTGIGGAPGPIVDNDGNGSLFRRVEIMATETAAIATLNGLFENPLGHYVNFHTTVHPGGAIRGQISRDVLAYRTDLLPTNEAPPSGVVARGVGTLTLNVTRDGRGNVTSGTALFEVDYSFPTGVTLTGLHIHNGPEGVSTGVVIGSDLSSKTQAFDSPVAVVEINSGLQDARATIRNDGRELFFFSDRAGSLGLTDLWTSTRPSSTAAWSTPVNLGSTVNSTSADAQPALSRDGRTLYFASSRPGSLGALDIYTTRRSAPDSNDWSAPVNLGPAINSAFDDDGPAISPDGLTLYFNSTRPGGSGAQDIWVAKRTNENAAWGAPVNLASVNTSANDFAPAFSGDGQRMFFVSNRPGGFGGLDIWVSFRENNADDFAWQTPANLGAPVNTAFSDAGPGLLGGGDTEILFFTSNRSGGSGGPDIWLSTRDADGTGAITPGPVAVTSAAGVAALNGILLNPSLFYMNLHTTDSPGGAIRGQLESEIFVFRPTLRPENEIPANTVNASAASLISFRVTKDATGQITGGLVDFAHNFSFPGAVTITALHINRGTASENGATLIGAALSAPVVDTDGGGNIFERVEILPTDGAGVGFLREILAAPTGYYVHIQTSANPAGAIRNQLATQMLEFAQSGGGADFVSLITLNNASTTRSVSGVAYFFNQTGGPQTVAVNDAVVPFSIPPSGTRVFSNNPKGASASGYARIFTDSGQFLGFGGGVDENVTYSYPGLTSAFARSQQRGKFSAPVSFVGGRDPAVAVVNTRAVKSRVSFSLIGANGLSSAFAFVDLAPGEQRSVFLREIFTGTGSTIFGGGTTFNPDGFAGKVRVTSIGDGFFQANGLFGLALEFTQTGIRWLPTAIIP